MALKTRAAQAPGAAAALAVACSGGRDSTALLHAVLRQATGTDLPVHALHVHHGLMPQADAWLSHLRAQCTRWRRWAPQLHFHFTRLQGKPSAGESIEAWARRERYAALTQMAHAAGASHVLLAHHRRDQAETVLLQLLRGAGPAGLSAMPQAIEREGLCWLRPWLLHPAEAIEAYVCQHQLRHIEDDSNQDERFDRNRLRHAVMPALSAAFPQAERQLQRAARQAQAARALIDETAAADLLLLGGAAAEQGGAFALPVPAWRALSPARRRFALRAWLQRVAPAAADSLLERLLEELPGATAGRWPLNGYQELRLYRHALAPHALGTREPVTDASTIFRLPSDASAGEWAVPRFAGRLQLLAVTTGGLPLSLLGGAELIARTGGEQFQQATRCVPRALKKQFQAAAVPAWARAAPLLRADAGEFGPGPLLFVPGLGVDARVMADPGTPQLLPRWLPDD